MIEIKELVCDISNVASFNKRKNKPKVKYIDLLFNTVPNEFEIMGIADCSLYHQIDDNKRYKKEYLVPELIFEAPNGVEADNFILTYALQNDTLVLSNDKFRQYDFVSKNWLEEHRICFMIIKNQLFFQEPTDLIFSKKQNVKPSVRIQDFLKLKEKQLC